MVIERGLIGRACRVVTGKNRADDSSNFEKFIQVGRLLQVQVRAESNGAFPVGGGGRGCQHNDGNAFQPGLLANLAQDSVPIVFREINIKNDQVGVPSGRGLVLAGGFLGDTAARWVEVEQMNGSLAVCGNHNIAGDVAAGERLPKQENVARVVFGQQDLEHFLVTYQDS